MIKVSGKEVTQDNFPDGTLLMKLDKILYSQDYVNIDWKYENDSELFALICVVRHINNYDTTKKINLHMDYIPHARQDRVKQVEDVFTLKYFCEVINSLKFENVFVCDAHSNVALALLDRVCDIRPWHNIKEAIRLVEKDLPEDEALMAFFPDEGAMKRYSFDMNLPFAFGVKRRDWETGKILGLDLAGEVDSVAGRNILIIDDICSRGGTFYHSAKALKEAGAANIYLYITHCENTIHEGELLNSDLIKHIYTTDSILTKKHEKITIL